MMPVLFRIPFINLDVPGYGLMLAVAFLASIFWAARRALKSRGNPDVVLNVGFVALIGGVVGSRAMHVIHNWNEEFANYHGLDLAFAIINLTRGGMEFYGGFLLATAGTIFYLWRARHSLRWYLDILAPSAALGLAIGRLGCFLNGCCWGAACDLPWAVRFPYGSGAQVQEWKDSTPGSALPQELLRINEVGGAVPIFRESLAASDAEIAAAQKTEDDFRAQQVEWVRQAEAAKGNPEEVARLRKKAAAVEPKIREAHARYADIRAQMKKYGLSAAQIHGIAAAHPSPPVHPTQIYSTITALLIALLLDALYWRRTRDGVVICLLFTIEPVTRIILELIRVDNPLDVFGVLTISQFLGICQFVCGVLALAFVSRLPARSPLAVEWEPPPEESGDQAPEKHARGKKAAAAAR